MSTSVSDNYPTDKRHGSLGPILVGPGPQGLKPKRQKNYSASMTICRKLVKKEAPNIATKPSMATSNTVSSVPIIQSIISRIGAPVILTIKLNSFVEEAGVS